MNHIEWHDLVMQLEAETTELNGERMQARHLKEKVEEALSKAESLFLDQEIVNRLDTLLIRLTEASKENVCTNTKCPHHNKKCKMR